MQMLLRAINRGFLSNFPFLTAELVHEHLANMPATAKGQMKLCPLGHYSTRQTQPMHGIANVFCFAALADKQRGTFYTDCTGNLPTSELSGQQLFFIAYDYGTN